MIENISAVIIVKNGAKTIANTLDSLSKFKEIIIYDNGSDDGTQDIVQKYQNVNLIQGDFIGFGETKRFASTYASSDWILSLDSDEVISNELFNSIKSLDLKSNINKVYEITRINFYKNYEIKHIWKNENITRIYNKNFTNFNDNQVHEFIIDTNIKKERLSGQLYHHTYTTISDFLVKANRYSTLFAKEKVGKKTSSPSKAFFNATYSFIKTYFLRQGFRDGYIGLIIAVSHAVTNFYKYMKLYEANLEIK